MPPEEAAKETFVLFATPTLTNQVCIEYLQSMLWTDWELGKRGINRAFKQLGGDPYLARVRNNLVSGALRDYPQMTDFFFIDDDVGWPPDAVLRLLDHPADVVAGIYPKKSDVPQFPCNLRTLEDGSLIEKHGFYLAEMVPTGFLRIKRHVLEKFVEISESYMDDDGSGGSHEVWNIFQMGYCAENGKWWGEDYAFCHQWNKMGGEIWVYPDVDFSHRGGKKWVNNFGASVAAYEDSVKQQEAAQ